MTVRDYARARPGAAELVAWDTAFDHARAVKSDFELDSVRDSVRDQHRGLLDASSRSSSPGAREREILAPCEELLRRAGLRPPDDGHGARRRERLRAPRVQDRRRRGRSRATDLVLPSLEVAGPGGHWVEVSRAICARRAERRDAADARGLRRVLRGGPQRAPRRARRAHDVHRAVSTRLHRARLRARPRHRPLDRDDDDRVPEDRRGRRDRARAQAWSSRCTRTRSPHDGQACLYMQDTWLVTADGGVPLAGSCR